MEPVSDALVVRLIPVALPEAAADAKPSPADLKASPGFQIEAGGGQALALDPPSVEAVLDANANGFTRRFDFPRLAMAPLRQSEHAAVVAAAAAPAQARAGKRMTAAQAMLALGLGVEAQSVLTVAATADGRGAENPDLLGLSSVAALLAGRPTEAAGIDDARLNGTDEVALWRAVRTAMGKEDSPEAAAVFAANYPLLLDYPEALRDRLLPLVAEAMALSPGTRDAAQAVLDARPDDRKLDLARGMLAEGSDAAAALAIYDRVAQGPDRLARARAASRAVELRLVGGALTTAQAADALDRQIYSWRGDGRELALRRRVAELRRQSAAFRPALSALREAEAIWPEQHPALLSDMARVFAEAVAQDATNPLPPLDLVALADENADLIPEGAAGQAIAARLADRLAVLDLPRRAVPVLEKLAAQSPAGPVRAEFGGRLADMRLAQGDAPGALTALAASSADGLPPALLEARTLTFARAAAAAGKPNSATAALAALDTPRARTLRAELLESGEGLAGRHRRLARPRGERRAR